MDFPVKSTGDSPSPSSSTSSSTPHRFHSAAAAATATGTSSSVGDRDPMHSWWESVSKQRSRILSLFSFLSSSEAEAEDGDGAPISSLADSDRPAVSLLSSPAAYSLVSSALRSPTSGSGSDPLCQWLYDTYLTADPSLRLVVLSFLPLLAGIYLSRIHSSDSSALPSLAGFEAVLLAIYAAEVKARAGKPILVQIPDLSQPSLYHTPRGGTGRSRDSTAPAAAASVGVLSPPLEPQIAVKSTKRAGIVGVALQCYFKEISQMPACSKLEFCRFAGSWAGQDCPCKEKSDGDEPQTLVLTNGFANSSFNSSNGDSVEIEEEFGKLAIRENGEHLSSEVGGVRIPLPWELLQPSLRILGHCLLSPLDSQDVKDAASNAVRSLYARASHDLSPQAILATRSLVNLDKSSRASAKAAAAAVAASAVNGSSNANTPSKAKKPEILLASK